MSVFQLQALSNLLGLAALFGLWFFVVKPAVLDTFRQEMFRLRDELFEYAALGNVSSESAAYQMVRQRINTSIRYAERLDLVTYIGMQGIVKNHQAQKTYSAQLQSALDDLDPGVSRELHRYITKTNDYLTVYVCARSTFLTIALMAIYFAVSAFARNGKRRKNPLSHTGEAIDMEAAITC